MPKGYKKTCIKDLEKKHKEVKKTIKQLEKELDKLYIEKIHLDGCIGYYNDDSEDFMKQINPSSPPPDDPSPPPPPIPPRPQEHQKSFVEHLGSALFSAIPRQEQWTSSVCTHQFALECDRRGEREERRKDPPLPESFTLFREHPLVLYIIRLNTDPLHHHHHHGQHHQSLNGMVNVIVTIVSMDTHVRNINIVTVT